MPVFRTPDGKIIEEPTKKMPSVEGSVTEDTGPIHRPPASASDLDAKTQPIGRAGWTRGAPGVEEDGNTRVVGRRKRPQQPNQAEPQAGNLPCQPDAMEDPPAGWLVVIAGPGQGRVLQLGLGANSIGRDSDNRLVMDFGDKEISRKSHAVVTYDPRSRKYYVNHGGGINLTYVGDAPVLTPSELKPGTDIALGNSTLHFVPLCDETFDWKELE